jgi:hypothetical protein
MNLRLQKPKIHAPKQSFPHKNPRKTEVNIAQTRIGGVSTTTPQYLVVLYLTRTTYGAIFTLTVTLGEAPVASATPLTWIRFRRFSVTAETFT